MRRSKLLSLALAFAAVLTSCNKATVAGDEFVTLDVSRTYPEKELVLQDFMDVEYVALETNDEFLTRGHVADVGEKYIVVTNNYDEGDVFLFDRHTGKGVRRINHKGPGPEDYTSVIGVVLNEANDELYINDPNSKKIVVYDLLGVYKRSFGYGEYNQYIKVLDFDDENLIAYDMNGLLADGEDRGELMFHSLISKQDGSVTEDIYIPFEKINAPIFKTDDTAIISILETMDCYKDGMLIADTSSDTVYFYSQARELVPFLAKEHSSSVGYFITMGTMTDRYYFIEARKKEFKKGEGFPYVHLMYDKQEHALYTPVITIKEYPDDKANMYYLPKNKPNVANINVWQADALVEALENGKLQGELKEIAERLDEEDNPVIMIMKEKK